MTHRVVLVLAATVLVVQGRLRGKPIELWSQGLYQGDILRRPDEGDRNAIAHDRLKWPNNTIPYELDPSVLHIKGAIMEAMEQYSKNTCIRFKERTNERDYVDIFQGYGCYSMVGCIGRSQPLSLDDGCEAVGTIVHELGHAVGFDHEQNRSDRDDYIDIYWDNINYDGEGQFDKLEPTENRLLTKFDYSGIMLYGEYAFSIYPGVLKTMEDKSRRRKLQEPHEKEGLTKSDIQRVNILYCGHPPVE